MENNNITMEEVCKDYNEATRLYHDGWEIKDKEKIIEDYGKGVFNFIKHFENYNNKINSSERV